MEREDIHPFVFFVLFVVNPPNHYHNAIDSIRKGLNNLNCYSALSGASALSVAISAFSAGTARSCITDC